MTEADELLLNAETIDDIKKALALGADVNTQDEDGHTILLYAVLEDDEEMVKFLLQKGADVNKRDKYGSSILFVANSYKVVRMLIEAGADEKSKEEALNGAYADRNSELVAAIEGDHRIYTSIIKPHVDEIKAKLKEKRRKESLSGAVVADKIAEDMISGKEKRTITRKVGKEFSDKYKREYALRRKQNREG